MRAFRMITAFLVVVAVMVSVTGCAGVPMLKDEFLYHDDSWPADTVTPEGTETTDLPVTDPTEEPATDPPTQPTEILLDPIGEDHIGSYSREELLGLDPQNNPYGPGTSVDEKGRPYGAMQLNERYAEYDAWFIGPDDGNIYLTFDLGWENEGLTNKILDTLKEKDVKAVFFVLKEYCDKNRDIVQRIIDEGHILASHAYNHTTLAELSIDQIAEQIWKLHEYIRDEFGYEMTLFRPPSGEYSEQVLAIAHSMGYRTVNWSYAYVDWIADEQPDVSDSYDRLISNAHSGCIYLLHTVSTTNAALMGDLIDGLRQEGYEFALFTDQIEVLSH